MPHSLRVAFGNLHTPSAFRTQGLVPTAAHGAIRLTTFFISDKPSTGWHRPIPVFFTCRSPPYVSERNIPHIEAPASLAIQPDAAPENGDCIGECRFRGPRARKRGKSRADSSRDPRRIVYWPAGEIRSCGRAMSSPGPHDGIQAREALCSV